VDPYKAPAGSVVVLDHMSGHVVAMASYPTFDNRWFNAGISKDKFDQLFPQTDDPDQSILVNRAVQGRYNIGSTIKPFMSFSALHSGLIGPYDTYLDQGTYTLQSIDEETCKLVRCVFKNALDPARTPSTIGWARCSTRSRDDAMSSRVISSCSASAPTPASSCPSNGTVGSPTMQ
jgi:hypothetical protein